MEIHQLGGVLSEMDLRGFGWILLDMDRYGMILMDLCRFGWCGRVNICILRNTLEHREKSSQEADMEHCLVNRLGEGGTFGGRPGWIWMYLDEYGCIWGFQKTSPESNPVCVQETVQESSKQVRLGITGYQHFQILNDVPKLGHGSVPGG
jgi:hypothetical protein